MKASVSCLAGICLAGWLGGCTVGSFDLTRGSTGVSSPPPAPAAAAPQSTPLEPAQTTASRTAPYPQNAPYPPPQTAAGAPPPAYQTPSYQTPAYQAPAQQTPSTPPSFGPRGMPTARAPEPPPAAPAVPDALTLQEAREQCWMASESTRFKRDLDQKVKFVEKCVQDKLAGAGR